MILVVLFSVFTGVILAGDMNVVHDIDRMFEETYEKNNGCGSHARLVARTTVGDMDERKSEFKKFVEAIDDNNARNNYNPQFSMILNRLSTMTKNEKADLTNLDVKDGAKDKIKVAKKLAVKSHGLPAAVDWVKRGAQVPVKNQGICGSCWAFGAASALEGAYYILTGKSVHVSEQQYVDCVYENLYRVYRKASYKGGDGCKGGWMTWAYMLNIDYDLVVGEDQVPYKEVQASSCQNSRPDVMSMAKVVGFEKIEDEAGKEDEALHAAVADGIVTVAIKAGTIAFQSYDSGIFDCVTSACRDPVDHAVTVVGYTEAYWNVRNSWGDQWGMKGYIHCSRSTKNIINIASYAVRPVIECRAGKTCTAPQWEDEEEKQEELDVGDVIEHGQIIHFGDKCLDRDITSAMSYAELSSVCDRNYQMTTKGYIQDAASKFCLSVHPESGATEGILYHEECTSTTTTWEKTDRGFKDVYSGKCWQPVEAKADPAEGTNIIVSSCTDSQYVEFKFKEELCWDEISRARFGTKIKKKNGKPLKYTTLKKAKTACVKKGCSRVAKDARSGKFYILKADTSGVEDKSWVLLACNKACEAGKQRCEDGVCKEKCTAEDEECPDGTVMCKDDKGEMGCRHEHWCEE